MALPERITFVTGNPGKVAELQHALAPHGIEVIQEACGYPEIQADTLDAVATAGAQHLLAAGVEPPFVLEDAGLFVSALNGFPGVYSRYAYDTIGCPGILDLLRDVELESRTATFVANLHYVDADGHHAFEGRCKGHIVERPRGDGGFGFDPIFAPDGGTRTFAQMDPDEKTAISHRGRAVAAFLAGFAGPS